MMVEDVIPMIQKTVRFTGRVQGVGFRATTASIARGFDVAGRVENLDDGRVEVVIEGEPEQVNMFLETISAELGRHIRSTDVTEGVAEGAYGDPRDLNAFKAKY